MHSQGSHNIWLLSVHYKITGRNKLKTYPAVSVPNHLQFISQNGKKTLNDDKQVFIYA